MTQEAWAGGTLQHGHGSLIDGGTGTQLCQSANAKTGRERAIGTSFALAVASSPGTVVSAREAPVADRGSPLGPHPITCDPPPHSPPAIPDFSFFPPTHRRIRSQNFPGWRNVKAARSRGGLARREDASAVGDKCTQSSFSGLGPPLSNRSFLDFFLPFQIGPC